jgi:hypothetical protein
MYQAGSRLGIRSTMRLARRYNRLLYGRYQRYRESLYPDRFRELAEENDGFTGNGQIRMEDGYAIDTSRSLPHLDDLLREADEVIAERGGRAPVDGPRAFFRNIIRVEDLERWPSFLDFITSSAVLATASEYMGMIPALSKTLPTGVRFVESGRHYDDAPHLAPRGTMRYHIDPYNQPVVYVIVLLQDMTPEMGPTTFLPASVSARVATELGYWSRGRPYELSDEEVYSVADPAEKIEFSYPRGTVLFVDTGHCLHYGSRDNPVPRFQIMYGLSPICRTDFSETFMPSFSYPIRPNDSQLRKLILDRRAYGV